MLSCSEYSLFFGISTGMILYFFSPYIGERLLGDARTVLSLKALAVSLPAISLTSALAGFFAGLRKVYKNAVSAVIEQGTKIILTSTALALSVPPLMSGVEYACLAVVGGAALAEGMSLFMNVVMYTFDNRSPLGVKAGNKKTEIKRTRLKDVSVISLPVAVGAYARQGLSTAEHLAIPWGMKKSGMNSSDALASYGVLCGMVFPVIFFPSAVLSSAAGLLIPELAELRALGRTDRIRSVVEGVLEAAMVFSVGCAGVFLAFGNDLGLSVYGSTEAGRFICIMAPLVPVMYVDTTVDCMLKGLGEQVHSMRINIIDSALSLVLVLALVPYFGITGYVISVYFCECLNCILSLMRLHKITGFSGSVLKAFTMSVALVSVCIFVVKGLFHLSAAWEIVLSAGMYLALSVIFSPCPIVREKHGPNVKNNVEIGAIG